MEKRVTVLETSSKVDKEDIVCQGIILKLVGFKINPQLHWRLCFLTSDGFLKFYEATKPHTLKSQIELVGNVVSYIDDIKARQLDKIKLPPPLGKKTILEGERSYIAIRNPLIKKKSSMTIDLNNAHEQIMCVSSLCKSKWFDSINDMVDQNSPLMDINEIIRSSPVDESITSTEHPNGDARPSGRTRSVVVTGALKPKKEEKDNAESASPFDDTVGFDETQLKKSPFEDDFGDDNDTSLSTKAAKKDDKKQQNEKVDDKKQRNEKLNDRKEQNEKVEDSNKKSSRTESVSELSNSHESTISSSQQNIEITHRMQKVDNPPNSLRPCDWDIPGLEQIEKIPFSRLDFYINYVSSPNTHKNTKVDLFEESMFIYDEDELDSSPFEASKHFLRNQQNIKDKIMETMSLEDLILEFTFADVSLPTPKRNKLTRYKSTKKKSKTEALRRPKKEEKSEKSTKKNRSPEEVDPKATSPRIPRSKTHNKHEKTKEDNDKPNMLHKVKSSMKVFQKFSDAPEEHSEET